MQFYSSYTSRRYHDQASIRDFSISTIIHNRALHLVGVDLLGIISMRIRSVDTNQSPPLMLNTHRPWILSPQRCCHFLLCLTDDGVLHGSSIFLKIHVSACPLSEQRRVQRDQCDMSLNSFQNCCTFFMTPTYAQGAFMNNKTSWKVKVAERSSRKVMNLDDAWWVMNMRRDVGGEIE